MRALLFVLASASFAGCVSQQDDPPCTAEGACLPGFRCEEQVCVPCEGEAVCTPIPTEELGPAGGALCSGANCLDVPSGALSSFVTFELAEVPASELSGIEALSDALELRPGSTTFNPDAGIELAVSGSTLSPDRWAVYRADTTSGPWTRLDGVSSAGKAKGTTDRAGLFVAARR